MVTSASTIRPSDEMPALPRRHGLMTYAQIVQANTTTVITSMVCAVIDIQAGGTSGPVGTERKVGPVTQRPNT
jgi:hypothetical protein